jgi:cell division septal protein FtsQ
MIIVLAIIILVVSVFFFYRSLRVKTIYVTGNNLIKESEILDKTNLLTYPRLYQVSEKDIRESLKDNEIINNVNVKKSLSGKVTIEISENKILYQEKDGKYVLSNKKEIFLDEPISGIPTLINDCSDVKDKFIDKLLLVDEDIIKHVSEIEYKPTELDKERFMFYMSDTNYVYITLNKITLINSYNEIYPTLEGKKGILYLDSGNHFEIKNKTTTPDE